MKNYNVLFFSLILAINLQAQGNPPCSTPEFRQFDFWVGEWVVHDSTGNEVGQNTISSIEGGCALSETWTGAAGTTGRSLNYYSLADSSWNQVWVDNAGTVLEMKGSGGEGMMTLRSGQKTGPNGNPFIHEIEWRSLDDGRVQQHWQAKPMDGSPALTLFLGFYSKK